MVLFTSGAGMEIYRQIGVFSAVIQMLYQTYILYLIYIYIYILYPRAVGSDRKYNIVDSNGRNSISLKGAWLSS